MSNNLKRFQLEENRGKYVDITFYSAFFSGILLTIYNFFYNIFSKPNADFSIANGSFPELGYGGTFFIHTSFAFILGLILAFNKKISFNVFIILSVIIGTLLDCLIRINKGSIFNIFIISIIWFIFAIVFLVFEKIYNNFSKDFSK